MDYLKAAASTDIHRAINTIADEYQGILSSGVFGFSILGKPLEYITFGVGKETHIFVGTHHGSEHITASLLIKFSADIADAAQNGRKLAGFDVSNIRSYRQLVIIPMLNPDGADIEQGALPADHFIFPRLLSMNPHGRDFTHWQANARGVDLNHNYDAGFYECKKLEQKLGIFSGGPTRFGGQYPESEPEVQAMCDLTRFFVPRLKTATALHTQGEEIYYGYGEKIPDGAKMLADMFSRASQYAVSKPEGIASYGGYKDWVTDKFAIPSFTIECGRGVNPLPPSDFYKIYEKILPILFICASF